MDPDSTLAAPALLLFLLLASAFFSAAEFALLTLARGRIDPGQRERAGVRRVANAEALVARVQQVLLAIHVGGGLATLGVGYVAATSGARLLSPDPFTPAAAVALSLGAAVVVDTVVAEQIPRLVGVQRYTWITAPPVFGFLRALALLLRPLTWAMERAVSGLAGLLRVSPAVIYTPVHTPEDIRQLVSQGHEQGVVEEDEREMIHGVFEFTETVAREVMTPRIDIVAVPLETALDELVQVVVREGHSRLPVFEGTIDTVVGVLLAKDLLAILADPDPRRRAEFRLREVMREPYFVPDTKPVDDILAEFRQQSVHLAIVLDEFGGTYGLLTMEDLLEEIVGEINDEYDVAEPEFAPTPEGDVLIDGGAAISEVNERFGLLLPEADFDTLGGYVFGALGRVPVAGDVVLAPSGEGEVTLQVEETEDRRVARVRLARASAAVGEAAAGE